MSNTTYTTTSTEKLLSACGGALVTSLMVTPMDVIKMRLQTQPVNNKSLSSTITACCSTLDRCTLIPNLRLTNKKLFSQGVNFQVASLHECALNHSAAKNPLVFQGTFVRKFFI